MFASCCPPRRVRCLSTRVMQPRPSSDTARGAPWPALCYLQTLPHSPAPAFLPSRKLKAGVKGTCTLYWDKALELELLVCSSESWTEGPGVSPRGGHILVIAAGCPTLQYGCQPLPAPAAPTSSCLRMGALAGLQLPCPCPGCLGGSGTLEGAVLLVTAGCSLSPQLPPVSLLGLVGGLGLQTAVRAPCS